MKLIVFVILMALPVAADPPRAKKAKPEPIAFQGAIVSISPSLGGLTVEVAGTWIVKPRDYTLEIERDGDKKRFDCAVSRIDDKLTTGDSVGITGKAVEIPAAGNQLRVRPTKVDGCRLNNLQTTSQSQRTGFLGVITEKTEHSGVLASVEFEFKTLEGKLYNCTRYLSSSVEGTPASTLMGQQRLEAFKGYKIGDTVMVRGFPHLYGGAYLLGGRLEIPRATPLGSCEVQSHTEVR